MANEIKYFFFTPSWDYPPPPAGPIKLGNIITSLKSPEQSLFTAPPVESEVFSVNKSEFEISTKRNRYGEVSLMTKFLALIGLGVDTGMRLESRNEKIFSFETLKTTQFIPSPSYLQEDCINASPVIKRWLDMSRYRKPLYIITGLKVVTGPKTATTHRGHDVSGKIGLELDGTIWSGSMAPISVGPGVDIGKSKSNDISWKESDDFVLAYRVRRIRVHKKTGQVKTDADYTEGAMLGNDITKSTDDELVVSDEEVLLPGEDWEITSMSEGDSTINLAIPK